MPKPPKPTQKRYRGRTRHNMMTIKKHIASLVAYDTKLRAASVNNYPNQLYSTTDQTFMGTAQAFFNVLLAALGPIPSRV